MVKVLITGPESTGKTTLARRLAGYYRTAWVPEYAREYLANTGGHYSRNDLPDILKSQFETEAAAGKKARKLLICDTGPLVFKVWSEVKFGQTPPGIEAAYRNHRYDLYLLCYPDLSWEPDPLRENPGKLEWLFRIFKQHLVSAGYPFRIIRGKGNARLQNAIAAIDSLLFKG